MIGTYLEVEGFVAVVQAVQDPPFRQPHFFGVLFFTPLKVAEVGHCRGGG